MHLVHTTQSMQRAKEALANLPLGAGEDFSYDTESESVEDLGEGPSTTAEGPIPSWMTNTSVTHTELEDLFVAQYQDAHHKSLTASSTQKVIYQQIMDSLKLQRIHYLQTKEEVGSIKESIQSTKDTLERRLDEKLPHQLVHILKTIIQEIKMPQAVQA